MTMSKTFLLIGSLNALLGVGFGAFGAHGLKGRLTPEMLAAYQTGVQYHLYHALGLLLIGLIALHIPSSVWIKWAGWLVLAGIVLFSGSLYLLSLSGVRWLGAITPLGGAAFIVGWALCAVGVWRAL